MDKRRRRRCRNCRDLFRPDPRNLRHQRYCAQPACRRASKAQSQRRWLAKPGNADYFRSAENVERVRAWRAAHPGYWRRAGGSECSALQEHSLTQAVDVIEETGTLTNPALQELLPANSLVLLGLIAHLTGAALQEAMPHSA